MKFIELLSYAAFGFAVMILAQKVKAQERPDVFTAPLYCIHVDYSLIPAKAKAGPCPTKADNYKAKASLSWRATVKIAGK